MNLFTTHADARLSDCGRYRYWLRRTWDAAMPPVCWLMLIPSTADAEKDDPTTRRCVNFARHWGHGGIVVVNLFALRATDPAVVLAAGPECVGEPAGGPLHDNLNDAFIVQQTDGRELVAAWGTKGGHFGRDRAVMKLLGKRRVRCLGTTQDGHPRHPLYVPGTAELVDFNLRD